MLAVGLGSAPNFRNKTLKFLKTPGVCQKLDQTLIFAGLTLPDECVMMADSLWQVCSSLTLKGLEEAFTTQLKRMLL
jgi:hypothetical protein